MIILLCLSWQVKLHKTYKATNNTIENKTNWFPLPNKGGQGGCDRTIMKNVYFYSSENNLPPKAERIRKKNA